MLDELNPYLFIRIIFRITEFTYKNTIFIYIYIILKYIVSQSTLIYDLK